MNQPQNQNKTADGQSRAEGANLTDELGAAVFEYAGRMYVRPCARGTILEDHHSGEGLEQILCDGNYIVEMRVWKAPNA